MKLNLTDALLIVAVASMAFFITQAFLEHQKISNDLVQIICGNKQGEVTLELKLPREELVSLNGNGVVFKHGVYVPAPGEMCAYNYITTQGQE